MIFKFIGVILFSIVYATPFAHALIDDYIVTLKQVSTSGKTIFVDKGSSGGIADNDYGVLVRKIEKEMGDALFQPVAKLRAIRVSSDTSIWVVYKAFELNEIKPGIRLFLFSETQFLQGRKTEFTSKRTRLITRSGKSQEVKDFLLEGDELATKDKDYRVISKGGSKEQHLDKEIDLIDIDRWEQDLGTNKVFAHGIYRSPYAKDFSERKKVHTFEKMLVAFMTKYNDPNFDYEKFYEEQKKDSSIDELTERTAYLNLVDKYEKKVLNRTAKEEKFLQKLQEKGDAWSGDYSDEELSELLNKISIVRERQRRRKLLAFKYNYQMYFSVNTNLINNENTNDFETTEQNKYDFEVAWEGYLFKKFQDLRSFTVELSGRRAKDGYYTGESNVRSIEYSLAAQINWYPFVKPSMVERNIFYAGINFRYGLARLTINSTNEEGNYQVLGFPGIKAGFKYNFRNTYGIRVVSSFERLRSERIVRSADDGFLPDRTYYVDGKIGIGLSKFF